MADKKLYDLLKIGLTEGEAKVYLALTEIGSSTVGPVVKKARVAYSNVYDILQRLIEKGIVSYIVKEKTKYFQAASPINLVDYLEKKEEELSEQKKALEYAMPELEKLQHLQPQQDAEVFIGKKGLKTAYKKFLNNMGPEDENLFFYIHEEGYATESDIFYISILDILDIPARGITNPEFKDSKYMKSAKQTKLRTVDFPIPGNVEVCKDKVLLISWKKPIIGTLIHSKGIADNIRNYFNSVWKIAKK